MSDILFKEEVFQIVGCAFEVLNGLGHGLNEKNYEKRVNGRIWSAKKLAIASNIDRGGWRGRKLNKDQSEFL